MILPYLRHVPLPLLHHLRGRGKGQKGTLGKGAMLDRTCHMRERERTSVTLVLWKTRPATDPK